MGNIAAHSRSRPYEKWIRRGCGCVSLALSLLCVVASFRAALTLNDPDAPLLWFFFVWGCALALGSIWLIRGRSKDRPLVMVRTRRRLLAFGFLVLLVVGCLALLLTLVPIEQDDPWWPLIVQTMFAVLIATLPFMLFDREGYEQRDAPVRLNARQRRIQRRYLWIVLAVGVLISAVGIFLDGQAESWWSELLYRTGFALLGCGVVLGYQLRRSLRAASKAEPPSAT